MIEHGSKCSLVHSCILFVFLLFARGNHLLGHLEPLFSHGKRFEVEVSDGFPAAEEFFTRFVDNAKPVLFRGGAMLFPAYSLWNDEYFLSFPESEESLVTVEVEKKENRSVPGEDIPFVDFVRGLHSSGKYMISSVPEFPRVHHVRSNDVNIAVNIWWRHGVEVNVSHCDGRPGRTIKDLTFIGFGALHDAQEKLIRNRLVQAAKLSDDNLTLEGLEDFFIQPDVFGPGVQWTDGMLEVVKKLFSLMDKSQDGKVTFVELNSLPGEDWEKVRALVNDLTELVMAQNDQAIEQEAHSTEAEQWQGNEPEIHTEL